MHFMYMAHTKYVGAFHTMESVRKQNYFFIALKSIRYQSNENMAYFLYCFASCLGIRMSGFANPDFVFCNMKYRKLRS